MRKLLIVLLTASIFTACGGSGNNASKLANDVCDCFRQANGMDATDPKRSLAQNDCAKKQGEAWNTLKDDEKKSAEFNKIIGECGKEMIQKSFDH